jgi:hypothetical protein
MNVTPTRALPEVLVVVLGVA